jgi:hypothetical protein
VRFWFGSFKALASSSDEKGEQARWLDTERRGMHTEGLVTISLEAGDLLPTSEDSNADNRPCIDRCLEHESWLVHERSCLNWQFGISRKKTTLASVLH